MVKKLFRQRTVKFLISGGIAAALNVVLITVTSNIEMIFLSSNVSEPSVKQKS